MLTIQRVCFGSPQQELFLNLTQKVRERAEFKAKEEEILVHLKGDHPLASHYQTYAYIGLVEGQPVIRAGLFHYEETNTFYLGFFEAVNEPAYMVEFIAFIKNKVREMGGVSLIGPVEGSFWYGYRMKLNQFDKAPFTAEPDNPPYYPSLWQQVGFELSEEYSSNYYRQVDNYYDPSKLQARYQQFKEKGIDFVQPKASQWERILPQIYELLSNLYSDFPIFHQISLDAFKQIINPLKSVIDFSMVRLAYNSEKLVGFVICLPDYGQEVYKKFNLWRLLKILKLRRKAPSYIIMYLGVDSNYLGLSSAILYPIVDNIVQRKAETIGALIHGHKVTHNYLPQMKRDKTYYGLFELKIE